MSSTTTTTTTPTTTTTKSSVAGFPRELIDSIRLNWNVMTLTVINTVLLVINLILVVVLIYSVFANSRRVIRFVKNYVRFYSQVLSPPERFIDSIELGSMGNKTTSGSSTSSGASDRTPTNLSNYSTTESVQNEQNKCVSKSNPVVRPNLNVSLKPGANSGRQTSSQLKSKLERTRNKAVAVAGELSLLARSSSGKNVNGIERETSSESLRLKMKRSESWDAKNKIYSNSSYLSATVAERTNRSNGTYNFDF